jgi:hypothetical protein
MFGSIQCANLEVPEIFGSARRHEEYRQRRLSQRGSVSGAWITRRQVSVILTGKPVSCGGPARQERNSREAVRDRIANKPR